MSEQRLDYKRMIERALHSVVREVLDMVARAGLPGEHHFYLTFRTAFPGVGLSAALRAQYPEEMTIVLQHRFSNLTTSETGFAVTLSFSGKSEVLTIPFAALTRFADPSTNFGLQFDAVESAAPVASPPPSLAKPETSPPITSGDGAAIVALDSFRKKR